jgi:uncharacterized protein YlxW (UPF0749 family)
MRRTSGRVAIGIVLTLLGFLVVAQLRSQALDQGLASLSIQDLTELVANVTAQNNQLRTEIQTLEAQRQSVAAAVQRGDTSASGIRSDLSHILAWSGAAGVTGAGVSVTVDGSLPDVAVNDLINELRNAGAEAISINGVRLVPGVVPSGPAGSLTLDGVAVTDPVRLLAVGQPETLAGSLTRAGGPIAQLAAQYPDVTVRVQGQDLVIVPPTDRNLLPTLGKPRL